LFIQNVPGRKVNVLWGHTIGHSTQIKKLYMDMYLIPNGFRDKAISQYSSKIVDKEDI
jgi:hypothetical protein